MMVSKLIAKKLLAGIRRNSPPGQEGCPAGTGWSMTAFQETGAFRASLRGFQSTTPVPSCPRGELVTERFLGSQYILLLVLCLCLVAPARAQPTVDADQLLEDVAVLAADSLEGRRAGSRGGEKARVYIKAAFDRLGLTSFGEGFEHSFDLRGREADTPYGVNLLGYLAGTERPDTFLVVTAHYDHLGVRRGQIFNGADDNASGVAGLLALADYFSRHRPRHSILFAALDAEEMGLLGASAFIEDPPISLDHVAFNVNLDMVSRNEKDELFVAGVFHYPFLKPYLERVAARSQIHLRFGHDGTQGTGDDWTMSSDHGPFYRAGIPFIYFGVEDHADYHKHTDEFENIDPDFFTQAIATVLDAVVELDTHLAKIHAESDR